MSKENDKFGKGSFLEGVKKNGLTISEDNYPKNKSLDKNDLSEKGLTIPPNEKNEDEDNK